MALDLTVKPAMSWMNKYVRPVGWLGYEVIIGTRGSEGASASDLVSQLVFVSLGLQHPVAKRWLTEELQEKHPEVEVQFSTECASAVASAAARQHPNESMHFFNWTCIFTS